MATTCDVSFDEMAVALSYVSLGCVAAAPVAASTARALPAAPVAAATKAKKETSAADDDDVRCQATTLVVFVMDSTMLSAAAVADCVLPCRALLVMPL